MPRLRGQIITEKEIRNEDLPGKIIVLVLLIVSLLGGNPLAVKISLEGFPPLKMAFFLVY